MPALSWPYLAPILLLLASNVFMTFAWYGHLKYRSAPLLLAIVARARDWNDGAARKLILQIFDLMRPGDPLLREYRMRLANLLNR